MDFIATKVGFPQGVSGKRLENQTPLGKVYQASCDELAIGKTICLGYLSLPMVKIERNGKGHYVTTTAGKFLLSKPKSQKK